VRPGAGSPGRYEAAGVDYATLDRAKRDALAAAAATSGLARRRGALVEEASRGEPAVVVRAGAARLGFVLECLGTKSMIARAYEEETGVDRFAAVGFDTVAAAANDCACVGALPVVVNAYFATGSAAWYAGGRHASLVEGFRRGCEAAGAAWGGGESPALPGLVAADQIDLAASVVGLVPEGHEPILGVELAPGDEIVLVASSGLHANGASLARDVAAALEDGWRTRLPSGRSLGEAVLDESVVYVPLVEALLEARLPVHYLSHITGHGLRKLMRAPRDLTYVVSRLPAVPEVLAFLAEAAGLSPAEAYGTLNMGAGFACYVAPGAGGEVVDLASTLGLAALVAGTVREGPRRVVLEEAGVAFEAEALELR